jgi:ABC-type sugar transport system ATPase subunit
MNEAMTKLSETTLSETLLFEMTGIVKRFGGLVALDRVDFAVREGEVMALVGDNGAGKSTLIKTMSGAYIPDAGEIRMAGQPVRFRSPQDAWQGGIATIYQELALAGKMTVADNIFLGREIRRPVLGIPFLDRPAMRRRTAELLSQLDVHVPSLDSWVETMSGGQRQGIAVSRAVMWASKVVFMDEPTAALGVVQTRNVLDLILRVRESGLSVVLISHNMPEVFEVADRIEVLRLGERVARFKRGDVSMEDVVGAMTGALKHEEPA